MKVFFNLGMKMLMFTFALQTSCVFEYDKDPCLPGSGEYFFQIDENAPPGAFVGKIPIEDDQVRFRILSGNLGDTFFIDLTDGSILVNNNQILDYENIKKFELSVMVESPKCMTSFAKVEIMVVDLRNQ